MLKKRFSPLQFRISFSFFQSLPVKEDKRPHDPKMPPKNAGPSKKTEQKAKAKIIEDKTFGLKNKNKSAKVNQYIKTLEAQVKNMGNTKKAKVWEGLYQFICMYIFLCSKMKRKPRQRRRRRRRRKPRKPSLQPSSNLLSSNKRFHSGLTQRPSFVSTSNLASVSRGKSASFPMIRPLRGKSPRSAFTMTLGRTDQAILKFSLMMTWSLSLSLALHSNQVIGSAFTLSKPWSRKNMAGSGSVPMGMVVSIGMPYPWDSS